MNINPKMQHLFLLCFLLFTETEAKAITGRDTSIFIGGRSVSIHFPAVQAKGVILMLPGWNFSKDKTCQNSSFCEKALHQGFVLICPEMGKSLYASQVFSNTRKDWSSFPQLRFITDTLQNYFQKTFQLLKKGDRNYLYGISTGARGVALILENTDGIYRCGALLSGDYDQTLDSTDNLMRGYYGSLANFKERWEGRDNPGKHADKIHVPLYIAYGKNDKVVAPVQSASFFETLRASGKTVQMSSKENAGHDYLFWESETNPVLKFFNSH